MIELAIVCGTLVLLLSLAAVFYLAKSLADTNKQVLGFASKTLDSALAINADAREFNRARIEAEQRVPQTQTVSVGSPLPVIDPNAVPPNLDVTTNAYAG
jgi:hypothetical protein